MASSKLVLVTLLVTICQSCTAATYSAMLTGAADGVTTPTTGMFTGVFTDTTANYSLTVTNVVHAIQAHLHYLPPTAPDGPVVVWLFNSTVSSITVPGTATVTGSFSAADLIGPLKGKPFSSLLDALSSNSIYVNVHTVEYPAGLIRGTTFATGAPAPAPMAAGM